MAVVPEQIAIVVVRVTVPGAEAINLGGTPEESEVSNTVETTIITTKTTWEN